MKKSCYLALSFQVSSQNIVLEKSTNFTMYHSKNLNCSQNLIHLSDLRKKYPQILTLRQLHNIRYTNRFQIQVVRILPVGGRLKEISKSLVQHIFGFLLQKHVSISGVTYLRISMPITVRVLVQLHCDRDEALIADWICYPFSLDS